MIAVTRIVQKLTAALAIASSGGQFPLAPPLPLSHINTYTYMYVFTVLLDWYSCKNLTLDWKMGFSSLLITG